MGGFELSDRAYERLIELGIPAKRYVRGEKRGDELVIYDSALNTEEGDFAPCGRRYWAVRILYEEVYRAHPLVVQVVEELGEAANGPYADLKVIEIPDGIEWELDDYDGMESVHESHRSWD